MAVISRGGSEHVISELNLVDLAGSERMNRVQTAGDASRMREGNTINRDLLCLGNVITALVARSKALVAPGQRATSAHIPYRACKLTRLLQNALGGNANTVLVACISKLPAWHLEQTKSTLEFAARAAQVVCVPKLAARLPTLRGPMAAANTQIDEASAELHRLRHMLDEQLSSEAKLLEVSVLLRYGAIPQGYVNFQVAFFWWQPSHKSMVPFKFHQSR
jgi:hypothetical protein